MGFREFIAKGKSDRGDKRKQNYINISVGSGFIILFVWQTFFFKYAFVPASLIWILVLAPSIFISFFAYKRYMEICGYSELQAIGYKILMRLLVLILIAMPVGNTSALIFLAMNDLLSDKQTKTISIEPTNSYTGKSKGKIYTSFEITHSGVTKRRKIFGQSIESVEGKTVEMEVKNGFFGYPVIVDGYQLREK